MRSSIRVVAEEVALVAVVLAGCGGPSSPSATATALSEASPGAAVTAEPTNAGIPGAAGTPVALRDSCSILDKADIEAALGESVSEGKPNKMANDVGNTCEFDGAGLNFVKVFVENDLLTVDDFKAKLSSSQFRPETGIGDAMVSFFNTVAVPAEQLSWWTDGLTLTLVIDKAGGTDEGLLATLKNLAAKVRL